MELNQLVTRAAYNIVHNIGNPSHLIELKKMFNNQPHLLENVDKRFVEDLKVALEDAK